MKKLITEGEATSIRRLTEEEKSRPLPSDAGALLTELKKQQLPDGAVKDLRAFARFYMWAIPLFEMGQVVIGKKFVELGQVISKRFMIGIGRDKMPRIELQPPEMQWFAHMPWAYAGIHYKTGRIILVCRPEKPLSACFFILPVDILQKIEPFRGHKFINIAETHLYSTPYNGPKICLELKEIEDGFFTKQKVKNKL